MKNNNNKKKKKKRPPTIGRERKQIFQSQTYSARQSTYRSALLTADLRSTKQYDSFLQLAQTWSVKIIQVSVTCFHGFTKPT